MRVVIIIIIIIVVVVVKVSVSCPLMDATRSVHPEGRRDTVPTKSKQQPARLHVVVTYSATTYVKCHSGDSATCSCRQTLC